MEQGTVGTLSQDSTRCQTSPSKLAVELSSPFGEFTMYHNPQGAVHFSLPELGKVAIEVYDFHRRMVLKQEYIGKENRSLNLRAFPEGLYLIRTSVNGQQFEERLILSH